MIPIVASVFLIFSIWGIIKRVDILSAFSRGVLQGLKTVKSIFPTLLFVLPVIALVRASGIMTLISLVLSPLFSFLSVPSEVSPLFLLKPLSGSGSLALLSDIIKTNGADSYAAFFASVLSASSETTFYVISVYIGNLTQKCGKLIFVALLLDFINLLIASAVVPLFF